MGKFLLEQGLEKQGAGDKLLLMSRQIAKGLASRVWDISRDFTTMVNDNFPDSKKNKKYVISNTVLMSVMQATPYPCQVTGNEEALLQWKSTSLTREVNLHPGCPLTKQQTIKASPQPWTARVLDCRAMPLMCCSYSNNMKQSNNGTISQPLKTSLVFHRYRQFLVSQRT